MKPSSNPFLLAGLLALFLPLALAASDADQAFASPAEPNWDRDLAMLAASREETSAEAARLFELAQHSTGKTTLRALIELTERPQWPEPAREAVLYRFTSQLRGLPPFSVESNVLEFLLGYQNRVLVAHEESAAIAIPLFPIRATAQGLVNQWTRQQASLDAAELLAIDSHRLVEVYADSHDPNVRAGIESAVSMADKSTLRSLLESALPLLSNHPEFTGLLGISAVEAGDLKALSEVFIHGSGPELVEISRQASRRFSGAGLGRLILATIDDAPAATAAVLIAEMSPRSLDQDGVGDALLQKLADPDLGSTAALAVAQWGSGQQLAELEALAGKDPASLTAKRARTALSIRPAGGDKGALQ